MYRNIFKHFDDLNFYTILFIENHLIEYIPKRKNLIIISLKYKLII